MNKSALNSRIMNTDRKALFIGANTEKGFVRCESDLFNEEKLDRLFVLKGSAGGGKSTFMKRAATLCEERGFNAVEYRCSSDPDSLDGVLISKGNVMFGIIDGTAPHAVDCSFPAAVSETVDLARVTSAEKIKPRKEEICRLAKAKKASFDRAYLCLKSAGEIMKVMSSIANEICDADKLRGAVKRFVSKLNIASGEKRTEYTSAFSMKGSVTLDTYTKQSGCIYVTDQFMGIENLYFKELIRALEERKASFAVCPSPEDSSVIDAVFIDSSDVLVTRKQAGAHDTKSVNMKRFARENFKEHRGVYRFSEKMRNELLSGAEMSLADAEKFHFKIEDIYISSSDYTVADRIFEDTVFDYITRV